MKTEANPADRYLANSALHARLTRSRGARRMRYASEIERRESEGGDPRKLRPFRLTPVERRRVVRAMARVLIGGASSVSGETLSRILEREGIAGFPSETQTKALRAAASKRYREERDVFRRGVESIC